MRQERYILITPARNEQDYIELTIRSMIQQTVLPLRWVIVSDGSTDQTDEIATRYAAEHEWIEFLRMPERSERHFGGKVMSFNAGYERIADLPFEFIGSLDADLSFEPNYFEYLLGKFDEDPQLGLTGTPFAEKGRTYNFRFSSLQHVSGACQLFRRACYEDIGGYVAIKGGGIDSVAVMTARMRGWRTQTFTDMVLEHHRPMGSGSGAGKVKAYFQFGQKAYRLGWHPLWQVVRSLYQMTKPPLFVAGLALLAGYLSSWFRGIEIPISRELMEFQRRDQMRQLKAFLAAGRRNTT